MISTISMPTKGLKKIGLTFQNNVHYQLQPDELIKDTLKRDEGELADTGALVIKTGEFTGRCPKDKFIVSDEITADTVHWGGFNQPIEEKYFHVVYGKIMHYLNGREEVWVRDCFACADPQYKLSIRVVNETPALNLFAYNMFMRPSEHDLETFEPEWTILNAPGLKLNASECGIRQSNAAVVSFKHKTILIAGTGYTGEIKKGIFTILNYVLPQQDGVLSMHCSANMGEDGDTALFFGLSGTGKTTLSADPERKLIGDDEHGWSDNNVFNFEGGCYAKCIGLSKEKEPEIFNAVHDGALLENTNFYEGTHTVNYDDSSITENTRVSYPLSYISNAIEPSIGSQPKNIFFLTCDANGVLPPISRLNPAQAMYQFISGYTAKVAGTEAGVTEPKSTFSACFGAPFLPLHPGKYAEMLGEKLKSTNVKVWLINTGWTGGSYGVGNRMKLSYTRAMISAALKGELDKVNFEADPVFGFEMPSSCPNVPADILNPRNTWDNKTAYDERANALAQEFVKNFEKYAAGVSEEILKAAPKAV
jgi:phosphoenolpyruvate carboxykinase (ATP)